MSGQPPPYEEAVAQNPAPLVVRLQVWHYRREGRSLENNAGLAALFDNHNLQNWEVVPLEVEGVTGPSCHDQYVPVEVQFRHRESAYNDPGERPMADVRELFFKVAPQFIYEFFIQDRISSTPHNLNIFPVRVPDSYLSRCTHAYVLNRLNIRVNAFFVPGPARTNDVQSWLREAANNTLDVLEILAAIVSLYLMHRRDQDRINRVNQAQNQHREQDNQAQVQERAQNAQILNVDVPERLGALRALFQEYRQRNRPHAAQPAVQTPNFPAVWNGVSRSLQQYVRLTNRMESRLNKLQRNQILSNQDLHELVQDAHQWTLHFSELRQALEQVFKHLEGDCRAVQSYQRGRTTWGITGAVGVGVLAIAAICFWWNPAGLVAAAAYGVGGAVGVAAGGAAGVEAHQVWDAEGREALEMNSRVRECKLSIKELDSCANQARTAIAMVFCAQVMQKRLDDTLPEHNKRTLLETLGVDVNTISDPIYDAELVSDRLRTFIDNNSAVRNSFEMVMKSANVNFETTEEAV